MTNGGGGGMPAQSAPATYTAAAVPPPSSTYNAPSMASNPQMPPQQQYNMDMQQNSYPSMSIGGGVDPSIYTQAGQPSLQQQPLL